MVLLFDLDDARAQDPGLVGAKAARLARARQAGLPVLPGVVVPVAAARPALTTAAAALADGGSGVARLAVMDADVDEDVVSALEERTRYLGEPLVVRSSSPLETGGVWAGAFSSFEGVGPGDLRTAVRGVWASAFTVHALQRCKVAGTKPGDVELAVLLQPQVRPLCGGSARLLADGSVAVHATRGSLRDLMEGWEVGVRAHVSANGRIEGEQEALDLGADALRGAGELARRTHEALGDKLIEWAWTGDDIVLLQSSQIDEPPQVPAAVAHGDLSAPVALALARLAHRFPGPLGEELVLPWALALPHISAVLAAPVSTDPPADLAQACILARDLTKQAWQERPDRALHLAFGALAAARGTSAGPALHALANLRPVDAVRGHQAVALIAGVAAALVARGTLNEERDIWRSTRPGLERLLAERSPASTGEWVRPGPDRWEPFIHAAVRVHGTTCHGVPVVPGASAGRVVVVRDPHHPPPIRARDVVVVERPLPALASLLWTASAMVATAGNPAAHLMEVTASLGVPTVLGVDLSSLGGMAALEGGGQLAAVDGEAGVVTIVPA